MANHNDSSRLTSDKDKETSHVAVTSTTADSDMPELLRRLSPAELHQLERKLIRKIDWRLLPMLFLELIVNYLDRNNISLARIQGLQADLNLTDIQYLSVVSIFFAGYVLLQVPSNLLLNKIGRPALYLPAVMIIWGVVSASTAAAQQYSQLLAIRFFLGIAEAAYLPGCLFYLSTWYRREELGFRTAMLYSGSIISGAFAGLLSAAILNGLSNALGIASWRWLFIIDGSITICLAFIAVVVLPNFPRTTRWLTPEEQAMAVWRLRDDIGQDDWINSESQSLWYGLKLAASDVKTWIILFMCTCISSSSSITYFLPTVVQSLPGSISGHLSSNDALLLTAPPYVLAVVTSITNAWHADRSGERYLHVTIPLWIAAVGFIIAATTTDFGPRFLAVMLIIPGIYSGNVVVLGWISNTLPRPPAKRAAALALINSSASGSILYTTYLWTGGPRFVTAFIVNCVTDLVAICLATTLRFILVRLNQQLSRGEAVHGVMAVGRAIPEEGARKGFRFLV